MNTLKNVVKKAIAVGAGTIMLGATTAGALAAGLADYPAPFIVNGQFDGMIVVGEKAASQDIIGAIDIAASLQASATTPVTTTGSTRTVLTGDVVQIGETNDLLEIGETLGDVAQTLSDDDLEMLKSGTVRTQKGTTGFTQTIDLVDGVVKLDENHDQEDGVYLVYDEGDELFTYELSFTSGLESDVDENDVAEDLEDESVFMLGNWYTISQADVTAADALSLELLSGDVTDTLTVSDTKTYEVDGKEYEVTVLAVGNGGDAVKFLVNGEATDTMGVDDTETLADGTEIGVRDIIETTAYRESDPGSLVEFYLGANKMLIEDEDTTALGDGTIEIDEESVSEVNVDHEGTATTGASGDVRLNSIVYTLEVNAARRSGLYLEKGDGVRDQLDEPVAMLGNWDIVFQGLSEPTSEEIDFDANGDDAYDFVFTNRKGTEYNVPYVYVDDSDNVQLGEEGQPLVLDESAMDLDSAFIVTTAESDMRRADTYVLVFSDSDETDKVITVEDDATGDSIEANYDDVTGAGSFIVSGDRFDFVYTEGAETLEVDQDQSETIGDGSPTVVTRYGAFITGLETAADAWNVTISTDDEDIDTDVVGTSLAVDVLFELVNTDELDVSMGTGSGPADEYWYEKVNDEDRAVATTLYGTWFDITEDTDGSNDLKITYPSEQVEAVVYVTGAESSSSTSSTGGAGARVNPVGVGAAVLDKDVRYDQDNMIVVGGPCANTMAAQLLQNPADCTEGFTAGHAMIRLFDTGNNVALLVAGYEAADTVAASRVVAESADYKLSGTSVDVTTANLKDIKVTTQ